MAIIGLTNMPYPIGQSKYRSPWTLPSFLPVFSSNSTPIHSPTWKLVWPANRTVALRPSLSFTVCPGLKSGIINGSLGKEHCVAALLIKSGTCFTLFGFVGVASSHALLLRCKVPPRVGRAARRVLVLAGTQTHRYRGEQASATVAYINMILNLQKMVMQLSLLVHKI